MTPSETIQRVEELFAALTDDELLDPSYLAGVLIPKLGLRPDKGFAASLQSATGADRLGLRIWQHPVQFAKFLVSLTVLQPKSYVEIGVADGGTFIAVCEYLRRLHGYPVRALGVDLAAPSEIYAAYVAKWKHTAVVRQSSTGPLALAALREFGAIDLALIDGDHSYRGARADYANMMKTVGGAGTLVFHDICNRYCPGVMQLWNEIRTTGPDLTYSFEDQSADVLPEFKPQFGLGVVMNPAMTNADVIEKARLRAAEMGSTISRPAVAAPAAASPRGPGPNEVVVCTAAGRRKFLEILEVYLVRAQAAGEINHWQLWVNTVAPDDLACIDEILARRPWASKLVCTDLGAPSLRRITAMWARAMTDPSCTYVKIDDDVLWIAPGTISKCTAALRQDPELAVVSPWLVNNTIAAHMMQRFGLHSRDIGFIPYSYLIHPFTPRPQWTEEFHNSFLAAAEGKRLYPWISLPDFVFTEPAQAFGIQFLVLRGEDAVPWARDMVAKGAGDEVYMTAEVQRLTKRHAKFVGSTLAVHFSYGPQRDHPVLATALPRYAALATTG